jgi:hypothetical protein
VVVAERAVPPEPADVLADCIKSIAMLYDQVSERIASADSSRGW